MARILVVDDSPVQAKHLQFIFRDAGHNVDTAGNGVLALDAIRTNTYDVVFTDMHMPEMNGLELVDSLRSEFPGLPVVLSTGFGSEELAVEALKAGASSYVPKRNLARDAVPILNEILSVSESRKKQSLFMDRMSSAEYQFVLENDTNLIPQMVGHAEALMTNMNLFDQSDRVRIGVAIHEALVNAMVHGNLQISSELKAGDWDIYHNTITERNQQEPYKDRRVTLRVRVRKGPYLQVQINDQGPGFDPSKLPDPTDPANMERASGRGLLLIRTFFDNVVHNSTGNEIVMTKGTGS
jgi:CheY-like chemotaxis protein